jgi:hypothetical protein
MWWVAVAFAYETDQLTDRDERLFDAGPVADAKMGRLLDEAVAATNLATKCAGDDPATRNELAKQIQWVTGGLSARVPERGFQRSFGFGAYAAWLETGPIDRHEFAWRQDIFGDVRLFDSVALRIAGPSSTIRIGEVLLGTDKIDHFLVEGYGYYRIAGDDGTREKFAIWYGTMSELTFYGDVSSQTFSFADLRANWDGYQFYRELLTSRSVLQRDADGCVHRVAPFRWEDIVNADYDEVLNPSVYRPSVEERVRQRLEEERPMACARWLANMPDDLTVPPYAAEFAPERVDPYDRAHLCGTP